MTSQIKCNCYMKCHCMEMKCESCNTGIIFNVYKCSSIPVCICESKKELYNESDICICKYKCLCILIKN